MKVLISFFLKNKQTKKHKHLKFDVEHQTSSFSIWPVECIYINLYIIKINYTKYKLDLDLYIYILYPLIQVFFFYLSWILFSKSYGNTLLGTSSHY